MNVSSSKEGVSEAIRTTHAVLCAQASDFDPSLQELYQKWLVKSVPRPRSSSWARARNSLAVYASSSLPPPVKSQPSFRPRRINALRVTLVVVLLSAAAALGSAAWLTSTSADDARFESHFSALATTLLARFDTSVGRLTQAALTLAEFAISSSAVKFPALSFSHSHNFCRPKHGQISRCRTRVASDVTCLLARTHSAFQWDKVTSHLLALTSADRFAFEVVLNASTLPGWLAYAAENAFAGQAAGLTSLINGSIRLGDAWAAAGGVVVPSWQARADTLRLGWGRIPPRVWCSRSDQARAGLLLRPAHRSRRPTSSHPAACTTR